MKKDLSWKIYLKRTAIALIAFEFVLLGINLALDYIPEKNNKPKIENNYDISADSLNSVISKLSPERLSELRDLYKQTYGNVIKSPEDSSTYLPLTELNVENVVVFDDLYNIPEQIEWRKRGDVAVLNDTIYVQDFKGKYRLTSASAYTDFPQVAIHYIKYDGNDEKMKKWAKSLNEIRTSDLMHELRHIDNNEFILQVPQNKRTRKIAAANEFLATVGGFLEGRAEKTPAVIDFDKLTRTKANIKDVNYILPPDSEKIVDSVILSALDKLEGMPGYRLKFVSDDSSFDAGLQKQYSENPITEKEAINSMRQRFKVNGKYTDILKLASEKVRKRAESFIDSDDYDMRLVMSAKKHNAKF